MFEVKVNVTRPEASNAIVITKGNGVVSGTAAEVKELYKVLKNLFEEEDCGCGGCEVNINEAILETLDLDTVVAAFDDLAGDETVKAPHIAEAIQYRAVNLGNR